MVILGGGIPVLQAPVFNGLEFDFLPLHQNDVAASEVDVGGRWIADAIMIAVVVVVLDESPDVSFEVTGQVLFIQQDAILERLMPALDLALGLGMVGGATDITQATEFFE